MVRISRITGGLGPSIEKRARKCYPLYSSPTFVRRSLFQKFSTFWRSCFNAMDQGVMLRRWNKENLCEKWGKSLFFGQFCQKKNLTNKRPIFCRNFLSSKFAIFCKDFLRFCVLIYPPADITRIKSFLRPALKLTKSNKPVFLMELLHSSLFLC